jgi:hypothetical protein
MRYSAFDNGFPFESDRHLLSVARLNLKRNTRISVELRAQCGVYVSGARGYKRESAWAEVDGAKPAVDHLGRGNHKAIVVVNANRACCQALARFP